MGKYNDLTGQVFGRLTVLYRAEDKVSLSGNRKVMWHCRCACGVEKDISADLLRRGSAKSCGCLQKELSSKRSLEDLTGRQFGRLAVLYRVEDCAYKSGEKRVRWHCRCNCGNEIDVLAKSLKNGMTQSCGCLKRDHTSAFFLDDLTGKTFGRWLVAKRVDDYISPSGYHKAQWLCICECGTEAIVMGSSLSTGKSVSCGCYRSERTSERSLIDVIGQRFGRLTVLERVDDHITAGGRHIPKYKCQCDCGKEHFVSSSLLLDGTSTSCGCYQKECTSERSLIDLTNQTFGKWTVLGRASDYIVPGSGGHNTKWNCRCACGTERSVLASSLLRGTSMSCGCWKQSKLEMLVVQYFQEQGMVLGVDYVAQKKYDNLIGVGMGKLRYDFSVYEENELYCLIECQGEQHSRPIKYFGGQEKYEIQQFHDELKREHAEILGVPLLEIPHTANTFEKVSEILRQAGI